MSNRPIYNSLLQRLLVAAYRFTARHIDLQHGVAGQLYRQSYFLYKRLTDAALVRTATKFLRPGSVFLDIGANIGFFSIAICRQCPVQSLAFEPEPHNIAQLQNTIAAYGLQQRIHVFQCAVSNRTGTDVLYLSDLGPTDHKLINARSSNSISVSTTTLDDFFAQHADYRNLPISLIKMDIQGAELLALAGMDQTLRAHNFPPMLVEYAPAELGADAGSTFFDSFLRLGYRPHSIPDLTLRQPQWFIQDRGRAYFDLMMITTVR